MSEEVKKTTETPPSSQMSTPTAPPADENRRRTRSQTRNGGITPPAPVYEPRSRKRGSQGPGSSSKKGKKAQQDEETTAQAEIVSSTESATPQEETKKAEGHSEKTEPDERAPEKKTELAEAVDVCKIKKVEERKTEEKKPVEPKPAGGEAPATCALPSKEEKKDAGSLEKDAQPAGKLEPAKPDVATSAKCGTLSPSEANPERSAERRLDTGPEQLPTSEQSKIETSKSDESHEKAPSDLKNSNPETDLKEKSAVAQSSPQQQQTKVQESGDGKIEPVSDAESAKDGEKTADSDQASATPV